MINQLASLLGHDVPLVTIADCLWAIEPRAGDSLRARIAAGSKVDTASPAVVTDNGVAIVSVHGVFGQNNYSDIRTDYLIETIEDLALSETVDAIVLDINSPGGSAARMMDAAEAVRQASKIKPIFAQIDGLGASGAYYLASHASAIFASSKSDMVGSIGTRMQLMETAGLFEKIGLRSVVIDTGPYKSAGAPGTMLTEEQESYFRGIVEELQVGFTAAVSEGRNLSGPALEAVTDGRIFLAERAQAMGLIDGIQPVLTTLAQASKSKESDMSQDTSAGAPQHTAASYQDLQLIPGVTNDFVCEAMGAGWTLDAAMSTWMERQASLLAEARKEADDARQAASRAAQNVPSAADRDLADRIDEEDENRGSTSATEAWEKIVAGYMTSGMTLQEATLEAGRRHEEERFAYLEEYRRLHGTASEARIRSLRKYSR